MSFNSNIVGMSHRLTDFNSMVFNDYGCPESLNESKTNELLKCIAKIKMSAEFLIDEFDNNIATKIVTVREELREKITYSNGNPISFSVEAFKGPGSI